MTYGGGGAVLDSMAGVSWRLWSAAAAAMLMTSLAAELRMAVLVPYDERRLFSRRKVLPAVRDALRLADDVTDDVTTGTLVPGHRFVVFEADSRCSSAVAPLAAFDLHNKQQVRRESFFADRNSPLYRLYPMTSLSRMLAPCEHRCSNARRFIC